jgi:hypothetical protein
MRSNSQVQFNERSPRDKLQAYHVHLFGFSMAWTNRTKVLRKMNPAQRPGFASGEQKHLAVPAVRECVPARVGWKTGPGVGRILSKNRVGKNEERDDEEYS